MTESRIEGFVAGSVAITVSNCGVGVAVSMDTGGLPKIEAVISTDQSRRLRRLLAAAEKRAA